MDEQIKRLIDQNTANAAIVVVRAVMGHLDALPAPVDTGGTYEDGYKDALTDLGARLVQMEAAIAAEYQHEE
jgi:hypothetical protein